MEPLPACMIPILQEAMIGNFPTLHSPPPYSHLDFLREQYVTRNLGMGGLEWVDPDWLGPWLTEQERKKTMGNMMPVLADVIRKGWRLEQERRVILCDKCLPGKYCVRHPDKRKKGPSNKTKKLQQAIWATEG